MTSLAQFRDCHSCYDERSIDQKKSLIWSTGWSLVYAWSKGRLQGAQLFCLNTGGSPSTGPSSSRTSSFSSWSALTPASLVYYTPVIQRPFISSVRGQPGHTVRLPDSSDFQYLTFPHPLPLLLSPRPPPIL